MSSPARATTARAAATWTVAAVVIVAGVLLAVGVWAVGLGQYGEDYCGSETRLPSGAAGWRGPDWDSPITLRCDYDTGPVSFTDPLPVAWTSWWALATIGNVLLVLGVARHRARGGPPRTRVHRT